MHEELRAAFDSVHAEPELKAAARAAVARRTRQRQKTARPLGLALATAACAAVVVLGGRCGRGGAGPRMRAFLRQVPCLPGTGGAGPHRHTGSGAGHDHAGDPRPHRGADGRCIRPEHRRNPGGPRKSHPAKRKRPPRGRPSRGIKQKGAHSPSCERLLLIQLSHTNWGLSPRG